MPPEPPASAQRSAELAEALDALRRRVGAACAVADRDPGTVTVIAVTKNFPAADAAALVRLGLGDLGENRDQEAAPKVVATAELLAGLLAEGERVDPPRWHFVGRLQRNKARSVTRYAAAVHSVDRPGLVAALAAGVRAAERGPVEAFVQVSLDGDPDRGGAAGPDVERLADQIADAEELVLAGVMAVAPMEADPDDAFARLADVAERLRAAHPQATGISAGMSGDLEQAVRHGATHVRVGTALLGRRTGNIS
jgi:pyridoxal phosphate enzyme (YggS family)